MTPRPIRIIAMTLIVAGVAGALMLKPIWLRSRQPASASPLTWIPLPQDGMDARQWAVRELLSHHETPMPNDGEFGLRCGSNTSDGEPTEQYSIDIGDPLLLRNAQRWKVAIVPIGEDMDITIHVIAPYPPPPLPEPGKEGLVADSSIHDWSTHLRIGRSEMRPIQDALANQELWLAPQGEEPFDCLDGRPVMIEACVHDRYFARFRNCDAGSGAPAQKLWDLLRLRFPHPAPNP